MNASVVDDQTGEEKKTNEFRFTWGSPNRAFGRTVVPITYEGEFKSGSFASSFAKWVYRSYAVAGRRPGVKNWFRDSRNARGPSSVHALESGDVLCIYIAAPAGLSV